MTESYGLGLGGKNSYPTTLHMTAMNYVKRCGYKPVYRDADASFSLKAF